MISFLTWSQLEWTHPWWGLLALQPLLMALLLKLRRNQVLHYADAHLLSWVVRGNAELKQGLWPALLNLLAWVFLACALMGPRLPLVSDQSNQQIRQEHQIDIMVLLDVSPSMQAQDISPQRLQRAKLELLDLIPKLHGERLGLIAFSGSAGLIMPLNRDQAALRYYLNIAEPSLFDASGTALASALELAQKTLIKNEESDSPRAKAVLLLTDAEVSSLSGSAGAAVWEAADKFKQANLPLYILAVGTEEGATIPQGNGNTLVFEGEDVISRLDQAGYTELARKTGGKLVKVEDGEGDWNALYNNGLLTLPGGKPVLDNVQAWRELYAFFLLPALVLFVLLRSDFLLNKINRLNVNILTVVLLGVLLIPDVNAAEAEAYAAYRTQHHAEAQTLYAALQGYAGRMGEGASAYRRKDYAYAIKQFSTALLQAKNMSQREQALFNLGNSYFMLGNYKAAADAFLAVLKYDVDHELKQNARANLALTAGKMAELAQSAKKPKGIPGRRGREVGGTAGEDASDSPLAMDSSEDKKDQLSGKSAELSSAENAKLLAQVRALQGTLSAELDHEAVYRSALKKVELTTDNPVVLHKALIKIEANRDYVPQVEMPPW